MPEETDAQYSTDHHSKRRVGAAVAWIKPPDDEIKSISRDKLAEFGMPKTSTDDEVMDTFFAMQSMVEDDRPHVLRRKAESGDHFAMDRLVQIAEEFTFHLNALAEQYPNLVIPYARTRARWPVLSNFSNPTRQKDMALFQTLKLGSAIDIGQELEALGLVKTDKKRWACYLLSVISIIRGVVMGWPDIEKADPPIDARYQISPLPSLQYIEDGWVQFIWMALACRFLELPLEKIAVSLPLLKKIQKLQNFFQPEALEEWWEAAKDVLMLSTDGAPEKNPSLKQMGLCRAEHESAMSTGESSAAHIKKPSIAKTRGSQNAAIRSKIFTELKEEFWRFSKQLGKAISKGNVDS